MWAVAKRELTASFKNPTAYFIICIYALLSAVIFTIIVLWQNTSHLGSYFGFWLFIADVFIISVLSMKYFSEERKNKTDQLLLTSPTSIYGLVIGKYLGSMVIFLTASCVNIVYFIIIDIFGTLDYGTLFTNIVGSVLMCSTMISIALFVSSITESQLASAAVTLSILAGLMVIDFFAGIMPSILQKIISYLTIYAYYDRFSNGIIALPSIVYYLSMTAVFLFLTVRMIEKRRWS